MGLEQLEAQAEAPQESAFHAEIFDQGGEMLLAQESPEQPAELGVEARQSNAQGESRSITKLREAVDAFNAEPDKTKALTDQRPNFEEAIRMADEDFVAVSQAAQTELTTMKPALEAAQQDIEPIEQKLKTEFDKLSDPQKQTVQQLLTDLDDPAKAAAAKQQLEDEFPELASGITEIESAFAKHEPTLRKVAEINERVNSAFNDSFQTRQVYLQAFQVSGVSDQRAGELQGELLLMQLGATPDQLQRSN